MQGSLRRNELKPTLARGDGNTETSSGSRRNANLMKIGWVVRPEGTESRQAQLPWAKLLLVFGFLSVVFFVQPIASAQIQPAKRAGLRADRILVRPRPGVDLGALHRALGNKVHRVFPGIGNLQVLELPPGASVPAVLAAYQQNGLVQYAEPDYILEAALEPNDFRYTDGSLWGLHNTGIYEIGRASCRERV